MRSVQAAQRPDRELVDALARLNPLSYEVDALRSRMLVGAASGYGVGLDLAVLAGLTAVLVVVASRLYPRVVL